MLKIKKLDLYILKQFFVLLLTTFFICLFVIVMQFIWLRIDDMLGKGIPLTIMGKFFFYASLTSIPMALPLAILLASLMTFGNLGEKLELIAMKTAGISLFRIMRPLIVFIAIVAVASFFYSDYVIPIAQKRMWTLMFSFREKSLELEVPTGEFYSGINGKNIYARRKDTNKKALLDVMIYDFSKGFDNASITAADTVKIFTTKDKKYLKIVMINGESFENVQEQQDGNSNIPYRRESFKLKQLLFEFDTGFKELDESLMSNQHISKNIQTLMHDIDSVSVRRDSLKQNLAQILIRANIKDTVTDKIFLTKPTSVKTKTINASYIFYASSQKKMKQIMKNANQNIDNKIADLEFNSFSINDAEDFYVQHNLEWHLKFTLSFACLIFFFIGSPLGAIIGKGGLGLPAVISIVLFIIYYIINTMGQKMAREGNWEVWQGMWFSSFILLPICLFVTYKSVKDAQLFEMDTYKKAFEKTKRLWRKAK